MTMMQSRDQRPGQARVSRPTQTGEDGAQAQASAPVLAQGDAMVAELLHVVRLLCERYESLVTCTNELRGAMRSANNDRIARVIAEQSAQVAQISEIEKRRARVVGQLAQRLGSHQRAQTRVTWIADRCAPRDRLSLGDAAQHLRGLIERVTRQNESCRSSAESLALHMNGVMQQVSARLSHGRMYGANGSVTGGTPVVSALDIES